MSSKLREALLKASIALSWATHGHLTEDDAKECLEVVDAALAEPLRNCEVGTDWEQANRLRNICIKYRAMKGKCFNCPIFKHGDAPCDCFVRWAQMPYEKGDAK